MPRRCMTSNVSHAVSHARLVRSMTPQLRCCDVIYDRERAHAVRQRQGHRGFTDAQKREIVQKLTDTMVSIEGENMRAVTWVVSTSRAASGPVAGTPMTPADVKALAAGAAVG